MTRQCCGDCSYLVIRHYFVIHYRETEQHSHALLDYDHEQEQEYMSVNDTSTYHDTSICFLIRQ
jgi:hypothetical protein